ncbi:MAG: hypothetical protein NXI32_18750, partial [bacterium]|nr:hypothetical protein [bacterium]
MDTDGVPLDGDADGTPGGRFSFFFEAGPTIFVDKLADTVPGVEGTGSLTDPYDTIRAATEAARSRLVMPRDGAASLVDGESFMISDGINFPVTFEFDDNGFVAPGSIPVSFTQEMSGAELAAAIEAAIAEATSADPVLLNVGVTVDGDLVNISGTALVDASSAPSLLKSPNLVRIVGNGGLDGNPNTLIDNRPYLLGLDNLQPLADG